MIAKNGTWNRTSLVMRVDPSRLLSNADDARPDAQETGISPEFVQQRKKSADRASMRIDNWPRLFVLWQIIGGISAQGDCAMLGKLR